MRKNDYNFRMLWLYVKISKPVDGRLAFFHDLNKWVTVPPHATVGRNVNKEKSLENKISRSKELCIKIRIKKYNTRCGDRLN